MCVLCSIKMNNYWLHTCKCVPMLKAIDIDRYFIDPNGNLAMQ